MDVSGCASPFNHVPSPTFLPCDPPHSLLSTEILVSTHPLKSVSQNYPFSPLSCTSRISGSLPQKLPRISSPSSYTCSGFTHLVVTYVLSWGFGPKPGPSVSPCVGGWGWGDGGMGDDMAICSPTFPSGGEENPNMPCRPHPNLILAIGDPRALRSTLCLEKPEQPPHEARVPTWEKQFPS